MTTGKLQKQPPSKTVKYHFVKLVYRSLLFLAALIVYIVSVCRGADSAFITSPHIQAILHLIWIVYVVEMLFRFFPAKIESMGCQKQFAHNYRPVKQLTEKPKRTSARSTALVVISWVSLNGLFGILYFLNIIDAGILFLISLAYGVCDMICILFFCPFQTWMMKNKCCTTCRIYNWDFAMMFTPLMFVWNYLSLSLVLLSLALLIKWEILLYRYPERFLEETNQCLSCGSCREKLCHHKKQLRGFLKKNRGILQLSGNTLFQTKEELRKAVKHIKKYK